jgi:selenocysteine lyase/cysteine desulfurase
MFFFSLDKRIRLGAHTCVWVGDWLWSAAGNTHTTDSYVGMHTSKLAGDAARYVKRSLGAGPRDMLLFCGTGCTAAIKRLQEVTGMAVAPTLRAAVLAALPPSDRWVVFVGPYEHHSNLLTWRESLAEVVEIGLRAADGLLDLAALESELAARAPSGRPMLGAFSACSNVTGLRTDPRAVAALLRRHGAHACFDFACSAPYVRVDMRSGDADGYDAVFLSPHKFLGGPGSPGVLLMASRLYRLRATAPSTCGGGTVRYVSAYGDTVYSDDAEEREDAGTPAIIQKVRAALSFRVKEWVGEACIEAQEARMLALALRRVRAGANPSLRLLQGADAAASAPRLPVLSFVVYAPPRDGTEPEGRLQLHCRFVTKLLNDLFGVQARAGCACAGPYAHRLLGISPARAKAIRSAVEQVNKPNDKRRISHSARIIFIFS